MTWIPETIIRALCWTLLHSLWQGLILAVVAGAVMLLTKRARSSTRYALLGTLVLGFLTVSGYTFFRQLQAPGFVASPVTVHAAPVTGDPGGPAVWAHEEPVQAKGIGQLVQYFNTHASLVVVVWFIVFLARFVKLLSALVYSQRVRHYQTNPVPAEWQDRLAVLLERLKISRPVRFLESALIKVPAVVGWLKPIVLVPVGMLAQLSADQVESILLHELAHISRRDYLFNLVQHLVDTLFFFNPALLWVSSLIRTERENCCDDVAIRETRSRRQLIEALVSFHEYQQTARGYVSGRGYVMTFAGENNGMVKRVQRIVHKKNHSLNAGERLLLMGGVLLLCGAFVTINGGRGTEINGSRATNPVLVKELVHKKAEEKMPVADKAVVVAALSVPSRKPDPVKLHMAARLDTARPTPELSDSDVEKIIRAHDHGVTPGFLADVKKLGYSINLDQAIRLMDHGVSVDFLQSLQKEGYGLVSFDKAVRLVDHGVSVEFIRRIRALGFPNLTLDEAVTLIDHGVSSEFIEKWKKKTGTKLELSDYIKLQDAGIDPSEN